MTRDELNAILGKPPRPTLEVLDVTALVEAARAVLASGREASEIVQALQLENSRLRAELRRVRGET